MKEECVRKGGGGALRYTALFGLCCLLPCVDVNVCVCILSLSHSSKADLLARTDASGPGAF